MTSVVHPDATFFLPARRSPRADVERQRQVVAGLSFVSRFLDATLAMVAVLNENRQVLFVNEAFRRVLGRSEPGAFVGMRLGELLGCVHAAQRPHGCGTTEACRYCGLARAMAGGPVEECRIESATAGEDLNLRVRVEPVSIFGNRLLVVSALDISSETRRRALERIFFHDLLNSAGSLRMLGEVMAESPPDTLASRYVPMVVEDSQRLVEEISSQRQLASAENGELKVRPSRVSSRELLGELSRLFSTHPVGAGKTVVCEDGEDVILTIDRTLLRRVLVNAVKNALEAEPPGARVVVSVRKDEGRAVFSVSNPTPIPRDVELQVFQKSFSTKGEGRGLGAYSIRLLTERYLHGRVAIASVPGKGTVLTAEYPLSQL